VAFGGRSTYDSGPAVATARGAQVTGRFGGLSAQAGQVTPAVAFVPEPGLAAGLAPSPGGAAGAGSGGSTDGRRGQLNAEPIYY